MATRIALSLIAIFFMGFAMPAHSQNVPAFFQGTVTEVDPFFTDIVPGDSVSGSYLLPTSPDSSVAFPAGNLHDVNLVGGVDYSLTMAGVNAILQPPLVRVFTGTFPFADLWLLGGLFSHDGFYVPSGHTLRCDVVALLFPSTGNVDYFVFDGTFPGFFASTSLECSVIDLLNPLAPGIPVLTAAIVMNTLDARVMSPSFSECTSPNGAVVTLDGSGSTGPPDTTFSWVDDSNAQVIGTDAVIDVQAPLGATSYTLTIASGESTDSASATVRVRDTTAPVVVADLVPAGSGHKYTVVAEATDVCDADLDLQSVVGAGVFSGSTVTIARPEETGTLRLEGENLHLEVSATDDAGNETTATATP
jgi:hypothetical protein